MDDLVTLSDLIADAFDLADIEVTDLLDAAPLVAALPMAPSSNGTVHKWTKEVQAPVVGFRSVNVGRDMDHSVDQEVTADLTALDWTAVCDVLAAKAWRRGQTDYLERQALRHFRAALFKYETQLFNGQLGGDAAGFEGFRDASTIDATADPMVVSAGGAGAACSSVYAIRAGEADVTGVYKGDGTPIEIGDTSTQLIEDQSDPAKKFNAYVTPGEAWIGLQVASAYSIGRIANLSTANGLTDDLIYELDSRFPAGRKPTHYAMSRRSQEQLRKSRTATTTTGVPAPTPDTVAGKPIVVSDAVLNTEAAIS